MRRRLVVLAIVVLHSLRPALAQESTLLPDDALIGDNESSEGKLGLLRLGVYLAPGDNFLTYKQQGDNEEGSYEGLEIEILKELCFQELDLHDAVIEISRLHTLEDRITALESHEVDFVIGSFFVTPEREERVHFIKPYYYSAGTTLFAPNNGTIDGVEKWEDLKGKTVAIPSGYYATKELLGYGAKLLFVNTSRQAAELIGRGEAVALADITTNVHETNGLFVDTDIPTILEIPIGIAVAKDRADTFLAEELTEAMVMMVRGGANATILDIESRSMVEAGVHMPPNPRLRELVENPDEPCLLYP